MRATLFLLVTTAFVGSLLAQYNAHGCTRHVTLPSSSYSIPTYQPQCQCQCYQPQPPRVNVVPYNYCQPTYMQQNIVPQSCPVYQSAPIIVPMPPPPKDCECAHTTVTAPPPQPLSNGTHSPPGHPPICVQTVYVSRDDEEDKKEEKKKCECKKKKKEYDPEQEYEKEERMLEARRRAANHRQQQFKRLQLKKALNDYLRALRRLEPDPRLGTRLDPRSGQILDLGDSDDPRLESSLDYFAPGRRSSGRRYDPDDDLACSLCSQRSAAAPMVIVDAGSRP